MHRLVYHESLHGLDAVGRVARVLFKMEEEEHGGGLEGNLPLPAACARASTPQYFLGIEGSANKVRTGGGRKDYATPLVLKSFLFLHTHNARWASASYGTRQDTYPLLPRPLQPPPPITASTKRKKTRRST